MVIEKPVKTLDVRTIVDRRMQEFARQAREGEKVTAVQIKKFLDDLNSYLDQHYHDEVVYTKGAVVKGGEDVTWEVAEYLKIDLGQPSSHSSKKSLKSSGTQ